MINFTAKKLFTLIVKDVKFSLADVRIVREHSSDPERGLSLEFFFDGSCADEDLPEFNRAFEKKVEEQLQERRMAAFRHKLAARKRGMKEEEELDDDNWSAYLSQRVDPTQLEIQACREAGCMLIFTGIRASLSVSACVTLGEVAFPEYFLPPKEAELSLAEEKLRKLPKWLWCMAFVFIICLVAAVAAVFQVSSAAYNTLHLD
jgi:hypothetical protein